MLDSFLRQVTKDSYGPINLLDKTQHPAVVLKFHDAFSVLGWGRMPDTLQGRGKVNAYLFSKWNGLVQSEAAWKQYLKSPDSLAFRKACASVQQSGSMSSALNELAETFPIANTFLGALGEVDFKELEDKKPLPKEKLISPEVYLSRPPETIPMIYPVSEFISEEKTPQATVMGRAVWNQSIFRSQSGTKPLPFEFLCHYRLTESSLKRLKVDSIALPKTASLQTLQAGVTWDFPVIELILTQNPYEKRIGLSEALWMTGMQPDALQKAMLSAAWISSFIRQPIKKATLNALKIRFALKDDGTLVLNDNFTLDDFYLEKDGHSLHPDSALDFYQKTSWLESVLHARQHSDTFGLSEWKRQVSEPAPFLDAKVKAKLEQDQQELLKCLSE